MKISENAKAMKGTGGGPAVFNALTDIEKDIDRICHLSSAAAPSGVSFGVKSSTTTTTSTPIVLAVTPPRRSTNVAVVSPTSSEKLQSQFVSLLSPTPPSYDLTATTKVTSTPLAEKPYQKQPNKKRKLTESREEEREEVQLLKRQVEQNNLLVEEMKAQTRSIESMADSLRGIHHFLINNCTVTLFLYFTFIFSLLCLQIVSLVLFVYFRLVAIICFQLNS